MKRQTRKKLAGAAKTKPQTMNAAPAPIGHNSAQVEEVPDQLATLRDILVGPTQDLTVKRLEELVVILEERDEDLNRREASLEQKIAAVQTDLTEREQALNTKVAQVEAKLSQKETELHCKIEKLEEMLEERDEVISGRFAAVDLQLNNIRATSSQMDIDFTASLSLASKRHDRTIQDVGKAIAVLGSEITSLVAVPSQAAE